MTRVNEDFLKLQENYLFSEISKRVEKFKKDNSTKKVISLGIGDVTLPLIHESILAINEAAKEMSNIETFRGYGPEQGYRFLIDKIIENEYKPNGINLSSDEVFISDGSKCDMSHIIELFSKDNKIAIMDPVYPVYVDSNVISGNSGNYIKEESKYEGIVYLSCNAESKFIPKLPEERVDIIYLCFPNNPTGVVLNKNELKKWVDYAINNNALILFDAAYEAFISQKDVPHSIYEIEGAEKVAIEFKSFSKNAGFTGVRCAYTIIPRELIVFDVNGNEVNLNKLWKRYQSTKFNGVSYITQKAAAAIYTKLGKKQMRNNIIYYKDNAHFIRKSLLKMGFEVYGGINSPYIWVKTPNLKKSWDFFDELLNETGVICTPGVGFGPSGEGYFRLSSFTSKEDTIEAIKRIRKYFKNISK